MARAFVADQPDGLGQQVDQRGRHDHARRESHDGVQPVMQPEHREAAQQGREERQYADQQDHARRLGLGACRAEAEQLEAVGVDRVAAAAGDLAHDRLKAAVLHLDRPAAAPAHDVVVMLLRLTRDVGMVAIRQVEALQRTELGEEIQVAKERGAADGHVTSRCFVQQVGGREVARLRLR